MISEKIIKAFEKIGYSLTLQDSYIITFSNHSYHLMIYVKNKSFVKYPFFSKNGVNITLEEFKVIHLLYEELGWL